VNYYKLILLEQQIQSLIGSHIGQVPLITLQSHQQSPKGNGNGHGAVLFVGPVKDASVHDVLVIVGQRGFVVVGIVGKVVGGGTVQVQGRCQHKCELVTVFEVVYFAINVEQQVTFKSGARALNAIDALEFVAVWIEGRDFKDIFKQCHFGRGLHC